jgi:2-hydroxy-3-oxopropionate reductase
MQDNQIPLGFVGLGVMGKPMSLNLLRAGYSLMVYDINPDPVGTLVKAGAKKGRSAAHVGENCNIIFTMLFDSGQVEEVITGKNGVLEGAKPGSIIIDMSSISHTTALMVAGRAAENGVEMMDAPVSGGEPKAIDGTLSLMVGGKQEIYDRVKDILLCMGSSAVLMGEVGSGTITKLVNQIIVAIHLSALSEGMVFAARAGVDAGKVYEAIKGGLAGSVVLDMKMPLVLDRNFRPGGPIRMHTKDLINVRDTAMAIDAPIPLTTQILEIMKALKVDGRSDDDHGGIIQYWEKLADTVVKRQ